MKGNIFNNAKPIFGFMVNRDDCWDMVLSKDPQSYMALPEGLTEDCLISYIDAGDKSCITPDGLVSKEGYSWSCGYNDGITLKNIGYTGIDNGMISYDKGKISNEEFWNIYTKSSYSIDNGDLRLILRYVDGNNRIFSYDHSIKEENGYVSLNGGFLQGFYQLYKYDYKVLPTTLFDGWSLEFTLRKGNYEKTGNLSTLNDIHPENKGIFFYMGTRSENKWWKYYDVGMKFDKTGYDYLTEEYSDDCNSKKEHVNDDYSMKEVDNSYKSGEYGFSDYFNMENEACEEPNDGKDTEYLGDHKRYTIDQHYSTDKNVWDYYNGDGYFKKDKEISENEPIKTDDGFDFKQPNINTYETDNKFILFNRTSEGFNVNNWKEGDKVTLYDIESPDMPNLFTIMDRTSHGYTTDKVKKLEEEKSKKYNVLQDLYRNAFALQVKDDGSICYKYLVKDCDKEEEAYKILSESSKPGLFTDNEWHTAHVKIEPVKTNIAKNEKNCSCNLDISGIENTMKINIYLDGNLILISKVLPMFNFKALDDLYNKQESIPFNISLGGGTQGLCDTVYSNFQKLPEYILPLEKEFGGTFIGDFKSFKFYECPLNYYQIRQNYLYNQSKTS